MKTDVEVIGNAALLMFTFARTLDRTQVDAMAERVETAMKTHDDLRLVLDLSSTDAMNPDAAISPKGMMASVQSIGPVKRYAVIGAPKIADAAIETFGKLLPLESRTFEPDERDAARAWAIAPLG